MQKRFNSYIFLVENSHYNYNKNNIIISVKNSISKYDSIFLEQDYSPNDTEEYMCDKHLAFFRQQLLKWRSDLQQESAITIEHLQEETLDEPDPSDRATAETDINLELRQRNRLRKLIDIINETLERIEKREYGYCEETGEEIGLGRLKARPTAKLCIAAQEAHEQFERRHNKIINPEVLPIDEDI